MCGVVLVVGLATSIACFQLGQWFFRGNGFTYENGYPAVTLADGEALRAVLGSGLYLGVLAVFSLGVGAIVRHTAGAITVVLAAILAPVIAIGFLPENLAEPLEKSSLMGAGLAIQQTVERSDNIPLDPADGLAVVTAYGVGRAARGSLGHRATRRLTRPASTPAFGMIVGVTIRAAELIERKRNGEELSDEEIAELVLGYTRGDVPDYQMAAWCMAVYFKGLSGRETHALTDAMIRSGETLDLAAALGRRVVDKHSTGGVGDKTSLAVGPIVAACGVPLGKMSGRGLGHTGGTLDKLESIPGFRVELTIDEFVDQIREIGVAIIGQTGDLVPADKKLYALRDVTATVDIVPLIASSIMSKKLAAGAEAIVLDVKVGDGAFMKTLDDARILAEQMVDLGRRAGREVVCLLTDMDQPLGAAVGNALEVREAAETIVGEGPAGPHGARPRGVRAPARVVGPGHRRRRGS